MITMIPMNSLKNWMIESANILFDDSKNDLRSLPKSVRLQILLVLSFIWTTVFSLYIFSYTTFAFGWAGLYIAHIGLIFAVYMTFKHFHRAEENSSNVFKTCSTLPSAYLCLIPSIIPESSVLPPILNIGLFKVLLIVILVQVSQINRQLLQRLLKLFVVV